MPSTLEVENLIRKSLDDFYRRRINALTTLKVKETLSRKNPYLYRALGFIEASELIREILKAHISSSDETIFGDAFFEPIVRLFGDVSDAEGVDVIVQTEKVYKAISVKSGPHIFNSSQKSKQDTQFKALKARLQKIQKQFDPILGHCYGRVPAESKADFIYRSTAGQAFWEELTGEPDFYLKLIQLMSEYPVQHRVEFEIAFGNALNRFTRQFLDNFQSEDGSINWEKWLQFNSGKDKVVWVEPNKPGRNRKI